MIIKYTLETRVFLCVNWCNSAIIEDKHRWDDFITRLHLAKRIWMQMRREWRAARELVYPRHDHFCLVLVWWCYSEHFSKGVVFHFAIFSKPVNSYNSHMMLFLKIIKLGEPKYVNNEYHYFMHRVAVWEWKKICKVRAHSHRTFFLCYLTAITYFLR